MKNSQISDKKKNIKESYWLNLYSPHGNFEKIPILPIIYIILLSVAVSFIMTKGFQKIYSIIPIAYILYLIIYDLIYKIKKKKSNSCEDIDDGKLKNSYMVMLNIIKISAVSILIMILIQVFIKCTNSLGKLLISIFLTCALCYLGHIISIIFNNYTAINIFKKLYTVVFLFYCVGVLIFATISLIKEKLYTMILFTIPFWLFIFYIIYKEFIKNK